MWNAEEMRWRRPSATIFRLGERRSLADIIFKSTARHKNTATSKRSRVASAATVDSACNAAAKAILTIWQQPPAEMQSVIRAVTQEAIALCRVMRRGARGDRRLRLSSLLDRVEACGAPNGCHCLPATSLGASTKTLHSDIDGWITWCYRCHQHRHRHHHHHQH